MKKTCILSFIFTLLLSITTSTSLFAENLDFDASEEEIILYSQNEKVILYEDVTGEIPILTIPNNVKGSLLEVGTDYSQIRYTKLDDNEEVVGYVRNENIYSQDVQDIDDEDEKSTEENFESNIQEKNRDKEKDLITQEEDSIKEDNVKEEQELENQIYESTETNLEQESTYQVLSKNSVQAESIQGVALKSATHVYADTSRESKQLKSYPAGSILKYTPHNSSWYSATVYVNGKWLSGYIHKEDVDKLSGEQKRLEGYGLKSPTKVYQSPSTSSDILKSYATGSKLIYRTFSENWYEATVYLNGKAHTGYIHRDDVGDKLLSLQGYAQLEPTNVYENTQKGSKVLKSYRAGHLLKYRPYNNTWYEATVYLSGKAHTGYIHRDDVGNKKPSLQGYGQLEPTNVYENPKKGSKVLKSYRAGHLLKYRPFNNTWYEATVYLNGKAHTGYIHKDDVGNKIPSLQGYGQLEPTNVYERPQKSSKVLKNYRVGHLLKYRPYNNSWYEATVYLNGKAHTGYIHKDDVGDNVPTLQGLAMSSPTKVYSQTTTNSETLKSYRSGSLLKFRPYNGSWYIATVYINGIANTGYIHHSDVATSTGKTVVIDAGHGGHDPGANGVGIVEKELGLDLVIRTQKLLENAGYHVIMTRTTDEFLTLAERANIANTTNADIFVSIHGNSFNGQASGIETYWYDTNEAEKSEKLASLIQQELITETKGSNRGVKKGNFHVIRETKIPSALVEVGFIDNKNDAAKLKDNNYKNQVAKGIVAGIKKFFQIF